MSGTPLLQKAVDRLRAASGKYKVQRSTWVLDPQEEDEKIRRILPGRLCALFVVCGVPS